MAMRQSFVLDRIVTLIHPRDTGRRNPWNKPITEDAEEKVWAARMDVSAKERLTTQDSLLSILASRFIIRYRTGVDATWRVVDGGQRFNVTGVRQIDRQRFLELFAEEVTGG